MDKQQVAEILDQIGTLLELQGENPFKCRAYHNAARTVTGLEGDLKSLVESGGLKEVKGIGEALSEKISELVRTGSLGYYEKLKKSFPPGVLKMLTVQGLGPKKVGILYSKLHLASIEDLEKACKAGKLERLEGFGRKTEENILAGIEALRRHSSRFLFSAGDEAARSIFERLKSIPGFLRGEIAGSLRRRRETIGDIDIVVSAKRASAPSIMKAFVSHPDVERITGEGETKSSVVLKSGVNCDLRVVDDAEFPFALNYFTGSKDHNVRLRSIARTMGLSLNEYGFSRLDAEDKRGKAKQAVKCRSEEDIYKALRLAYVAPELREDLGEIEAATDGTLPKLVGEEDIRGTFHCHTTASDGLNTLEEMAAAAKERGWEYLGIADHSKIAAYANGLDERRVREQLKAIDRLNQTMAPFRIFKGIEVDILPGGELDFTDRILAMFDYVVASVHSNFRMTEAEMTKRIVRAVRNRYVTMLGHPTGRLLLQRDPYPVDMNAVIDAAADSGTLIEINAHPMRLDLDWRLCRYARSRGVRVSINPDAHHRDGYGDVRYGVGVARKGWLTKEDVLNTMPLGRVTRFLHEFKQKGKP